MVKKNYSTENDRLLVEIKKELEMSRNSKEKRFSRSIWESLHILTQHFSKKELIDTLNISYHQIKKAENLFKSKLKEDIRPKEKDDDIDFIKIPEIQIKEKEGPVFTQDFIPGRKIIFELKTKTGLQISIFE